MAQNIKTAEKVSNHDSEKCYHITHSTQFSKISKMPASFMNQKRKNAHITERASVHSRQRLILHSRPNTLPKSTKKKSRRMKYSKKKRKDACIRVKCEWPKNRKNGIYIIFSAYRRRTNSQRGISACFFALSKITTT